ncbi:hypothetical protein C1646_757851 [Rhizophagus diaphanus]|nr:hypothetical protein C1646_757851 [Rhizophagus diaphanus] [Rhizophagus sp. MUCL 43196]
MPSWKYSFKRLSKYEYVTCVIHPKKVICICGKKIKLNQKWEEDYLNRHVQRSECKADKRQRTLYNWFKLIEKTEEKEEYDSDRTSAQFEGNSVRAKTCTGITEHNNICAECSFIQYNKILCNKIACPLPLPVNVKFTPKHYWKDNPLKKILQNFDLHDIWNNLNNKSEIQAENLQLKRNDKDCLTNLDCYYENVAKFKRLIDSVQYNGPVVVMTDNTKLKSYLRYSPTFGYIVGSVLSKEETTINVYSDIPNIINKIKSKKAIAKDVCVYILQIPLPKFPPIVIALIPNKGNDNSKTISQLHKKLIQEIASQLGIHILSIGSDGAITEFQAQQSIIDIQTPKRLFICEPSLNIHFSCPVFDNVGLIVRVQDPKHAKKTARNAIISEAQLLTFGTLSLNKQDDAAAYRSFCSANFKQCLTHEFQVKEGMEGFAVYIFVMKELIDSYLNRNISPVERIRMALTTHQDYYPQMPFLSWLHRSESCEHFFGMARQINSDFDFSELIQMLPKISQYTKALRNKKLSFNKKRSVREEYVGIIQPSDISIEIFVPQIFVESHEVDISSSSIEKQPNEFNNENIDNEEYNLSSAIVDLSHQYLLFDKLDFEFLYNQRKLHKAYSSKPLERKFKIVGASSRITEELHAQKLAKSKKEKKLNKKNAQEGLIEIPNIETANICINFPLEIKDYAYNHHCYTREAIKDLNDISYISLHVFMPLHLELFTDKIKEGCYIFIHQIPSNIVYHIKQNGVVERNFLRLVGNEKQYYFNYFGREDIIEKILK